MCAYRGKTFNQVHRQILYCIDGGDRHDHVGDYDIATISVIVTCSIMFIGCRYYIGNYVWGRDSHDNVCGYASGNYIGGNDGHYYVGGYPGNNVLGGGRHYCVGGYSGIVDWNYVNYVI